MRAGLIYSLLLIFALAGAGPAWADEKSPQPGVQSAPAAQAAPGVAPGTADLRRDQELLKRDFKHLEKINQERIQFLEKQMESQNERFADYSSHSERNANIITLLGIFIALAGIVAGYSAIISARKQGREVVRKWIDEHEDEIHEYLKKDMEGKIDDRVSEAEIKILKKIKMEELMERVAQKIAAREIDKVSRNDKEKLEQAAFEAGAKVESERTYNDWESQAVSALLSEKYESAETSFDHAAKLDGIFPFQRAKALLGKASALASMEKWDESLSVYDDVIPLMENSEDSENIHWPTFPR